MSTKRGRILQHGTYESGNVSRAIHIPLNEQDKEVANLECILLPTDFNKYILFIIIK